VRIADRGMRDLNQERLYVFQHDGLQAGIPRHDGAQRVGRHPIPGSGELHVGRVRRPGVSEQNRQAGHALGTDQTDLDTDVIRLTGNHRGDAGFGKVDVFDRAARLFQHGAQRKVDWGEVWTQNREILWGQTGEQTVVLGFGGHVTLAAHGREQKQVSQSLAPGDRGEWCDESYAFRPAKDTEIPVLYGTVPQPNGWKL
jgi:hypothetical protein